MNLTTLFFGQTFDYVQYLTSANVIVTNDVCRVMGATGGFRSWFDWLQSPAAVFNGTATVNGVQCNRWLLAVGGRAVVALCATDTDVVEFDAYSGPRPVVFLFGANKPVPSTPIDVPQACFDAPPTCAAAPWRQLTLFRLHNVLDTQLGQRNFQCGL